MTRLELLAALLIWAGTILVFSTMRWFRAVPMVRRLAPFARQSTLGAPSPVISSSSGIWAALVPLATQLGDGISKTLGVSNELAKRLERSDQSPDVGAFRLRQAAWALLGAAAVSVVSFFMGLPPVAVMASLVGVPLLIFMVMEQTVISRSEDWQRRMEAELPVVIEQLGMLLSSGYSLGAAINRLSHRGKGATAGELARISTRIRQGVAEIDALREWAERSDLPSIQRVVSVLALNWEASDLGALISAEARMVRRDVQRKQLETLDRRAQQVWIPVTVATLLPGVIFMAVPFVQAMSQLTG